MIDRSPGPQVSKAHLPPLNSSLFLTFFFTVMTSENFQNDLKKRKSPFPSNCLLCCYQNVKKYGEYCDVSVFFLSQVYRDYKSLFFCPIIERFWMLIAWQVKAKYHLDCYQLMHPIAKKCIRFLEVQTTYPLHLIVRSWHDQGHLTSHICIQKDFRAMKNSTLLLPKDGQKEHGPEFMMVPDDCMA